MSEKLKTLRKMLISHKIDAYIQPVHDSYMSEYPPECFKRVQHVCGFSGSAGTLVVTREGAVLFVDGRYTLQAAAEVDTKSISIINSAEQSVEQWCDAQHLKNIGYDADLFTKPMLTRYKNNMIAAPNLADLIWENRPAIPATPLFAHEDRDAGESATQKSIRLSKQLQEQKVDAFLIAAPESVCWLLNIRAHDVECTPLALCRALILANGHVELFVDPARAKTVSVGADLFAPSELAARCGKQKGKRVGYDANQTPKSLVDLLISAGCELVEMTDPCILPRACKNPVQLDGMRAAHLRDGVALTKLLKWIKNHPNIESVTEMDVADQLLAFRREDPRFVEPSFPTIAGSGPNGAIVHYRAQPSTNRHLRRGELLLLDSGGQYPDGTTDITRTIAIGEPTPEYIDRFTRVLKGHIALATAKFPKGTRGSQLDVLARQYLWQAGLDYDHGTGHGVGQFLGVHEGPQRISKRGGDAALLSGMIISNEPGYYKEGAYGIRIENLVVVVEDASGMLAFETITRVPLDESLIDMSLLTETEKQWLKRYQEGLK